MCGGVARSSKREPPSGARRATPSTPAERGRSPDRDLRFRARHRCRAPCRPEEFPWASSEQTV